MASGPYRLLTSLFACAALLLVLAADVRACPWLITTIPIPSPTDETAPEAPAEKTAEPPAEGPIAHGSTLPDEALPRNAQPPASSAPRGPRDGGSPQLRGLDASVALVLVRELPQFAALPLPAGPERPPGAAPADLPHALSARRAAGWLSSMSPHAPPLPASPR